MQSNIYKLFIMKTGTLPWVPEAFRCPVLVSPAHGRRKLLVTREKKRLVPRVQGPLLLNEKYPGVRLFRTFTNR